MTSIIGFLFFLLNAGLDILKWILIIAAIMSWLIAFNVINTHNDFIRQLWYMLNRVSDAVCGPIRRLLPDLGGIDLSPLVVIILIIGVQIYLLPGLMGFLLSIFA